MNYILTGLDFDAGFNYMNEEPSNTLARLAPQGLDIYHDNIGCEHLEATLDVMYDFGCAVACGMVSDLDGAAYPINNLHNVIRRRLSIRGFIVSDPGFAHKYFLGHQRNMQRRIKEGFIRTLIHETVGIENAAEGLVGILQGKNKGKTLLKF